VKTDKKRSDWYLTKIFSIILGILLGVTFVLLLLVGQPYKGEHSLGMSIYKTTALLLILSLACWATVAFYETTRYLLRKNKENENST
jgi:predicted membrane channel-forming protein YqfA (hemolysin III family)